LKKLICALLLAAATCISQGCKSDTPLKDNHGRRVDTSAVAGDTHFPVGWYGVDPVGWYSPIYHQVYVSLRPAFKACDHDPKKLQELMNEGNCSIILYDPSRLSLQFVNFLARANPMMCEGTGAMLTKRLIAS
jgi:hypothetical protein